MANGATWIGGRAELGDAQDGTSTFLGVWLDPEQGIVAGTVGGDPTSPDLGELLVEACQRPHVGKPRRPACVRVADLALAAEVRRADPEVWVEVGPTPEIAELRRSFLAHARRDAPRARPAKSFVGRPWVPASKPALAQLDAAARALWAAAPWRWVGEADPVRVDAPTLGLIEAVACVVGAAGEQFGFALFARLSHYQTFLRLTREEAFLRGDPPLDGDQLMLDLEPPKGRKGAARARPLHLARSWEPIVADDAEVTALAAVAEALARFDPERPATVHGPVTLALLEPTPVATLHRHPAEAAAADRADPGPVGRADRPGRNDPCWCGSGKKYKKCHLDGDAATATGNVTNSERSRGARRTLDGALRSGAEEEADTGATRAERGLGSSAAAATPGRSRWGPVLDRMYPRVLAWAERHVRSWREHLAAFARIEAKELHMSHALFAVAPELGPGAITAGEAYRAAQGSTLGPDERRWLDANIETAWTSYWSVVAADPGRALTLRDLFSEEVRTVVEASASRIVVVHDLLLARVVTVGDEAYMDIAHSRTLGPHEATVLRAEVAAAVGLTKVKAVPVAKLRLPKVVIGLLILWEKAVRMRDQAASPRVLQTTDGEALVLVTERFPLRAKRSEVKAGLARMEDLAPPDPGADTWTLSKPGNAMQPGWERTVIASIRFEGEALIVETRSRERAAAVRDRLGAALPGALGTPTRTEEPMDALLRRARDEPASAAPRLEAVPSPELQAAVLEVKRQAYATWPDEPLPALGGKTARAAVKTVGGRKKVAALLDELERHEAREHPGQRFDVASLRRSLGLEV